MDMRRHAPGSRRTVPWTGALLLAALAGLTEPADCASVAARSVGDLAREAALIFEGEVVTSAPYTVPASGAIETMVEIRILDLLKGHGVGATVTLRYAGGEVDGVAMDLSGVAPPLTGERGVYFVAADHGQAFHPLVGWSQGHFLIVPDGPGGSDRVLTAAAQPVLAVGSGEKGADALSAGVARGVRVGDAASLREAMTARGFKAAVLRLATTGARP